MPSRALWKGSISFGLVTVPINLVSATEAKETVAFNLLHRKDKSRIIGKRFCKAEDVEVPWRSGHSGPGSTPGPGSDTSQSA